ncbi:DNA repair protein SWI5 homolog [Zootoca vivipara]|uniref:DNA repair protein SWI5 homolog n=1 Tax=Zootoca vivipara TaxID=8524 RepID=UPI00293BFDC8|nr:DNA repair protein SWI5 homolog [Zootoca vivipara]
MESDIQSLVWYLKERLSDTSVQHSANPALPLPPLPPPSPLQGNAASFGAFPSRTFQGALDKPGDRSPLAREWEKSPGVRGRPSARPFLRRTPVGTPRACSARFKSPVPSSPTTCQPASDEDALQREIEELKRKDLALDQEIAQLTAEGYSPEELETHISLLHEYNEIKDAGQMLLGRLAVIRGVTTKELYPEFELDVND